MLTYLVALTEPVPSEPPSGQPAHRFRGGHADLGMAHGISGPLALLALAMRQGITVDGHASAMHRICHWLDAWPQEAPAGPWWPERVSLGELRTGSPEIGAHLPRLLDTLLEHAADLPPGQAPGLIEGSAGIALTLHSIATGTNCGWRTCLLLN